MKNKKIELRKSLIEFITESGNSSLIKVDGNTYYSRPICAVCDLDDDFADVLDAVGKERGTDKSDFIYSTEYGKVCAKNIGEAYAYYFWPEEYNQEVI